MTPAVGFHLQQRQREITQQFKQQSARHNLIFGGARSGKTFLFTRAVCIRAFAEDESRHIILRLRTLHIRQSIWMDTLPKVLRLCWPDFRPITHEADGFIQFPNSTIPRKDYSELWIAGLDDKDRVEKILGKECSTLYFNECSQIPYSSVLLALTRLAQKTEKLQNKAYYDLNPTLTGHWTNRMFVQHLDPDSREHRKLPDPENYAYAYMNPEDNIENLDPHYVQSLRNMPTRQRKRFYEGQYSTEQEGQLWSYEIIEQHRKDPVLPEELERMGIQRIIVAVDPSGAAGEYDLKADEIGIVVVGIDGKDKGYLFEDASGLYSPEGWGRVVCNLFHKWQADLVVGEKNFGGDMVRAVIQGADRSVPFRPVTASRGKHVRAEPIASLYEQGRISHCGSFPVLEDEMANFTTMGYMGTGSPNHCFVAGTLVRTATGQVPIEQVKAGDLVHTRAGLRRVLHASCTGVLPTLDLQMSNGKHLIGTGNHPVSVKGAGWRALDTLVWGNILDVWPKTKLPLTDLRSIETPRRSAAETTTTRIQRRASFVGRAFSTVTCGNGSTAKFRKGNLFITSTRTLSTTPLTIWSVLPINNIQLNMQKSWERTQGRAQTPSKKRQLGIDLQKASLGIRGTERHLGRRVSGFTFVLVTVVAENSNPTLIGRGPAFAPINATSSSKARRSNTIRISENVLFVRRYLSAANTTRSCVAPVSVLGLRDAGRQPVFNLTVEDQPEFYANDVLVHNCDALVWGFSELFENQVHTGLAAYYAETQGQLDTGQMVMGNKNVVDKVAAGELAKIATSTLIKPTTSDDTPVCISCGSKALVRIGKQTQCNQCGVVMGSAPEPANRPNRSGLFK